jgi:hypothetical protein
MLATLASGFRRALTILCEIARIVRRTATTVAALTALAPGFHRTSTIMGKVAGALLSADMSRARRLLAIERKIASIGDGSRIRHGFASYFQFH